MIMVKKKKISATYDMGWADEIGYGWKNGGQAGTKQKASLL